MRVITPFGFGEVKGYEPLIPGAVRVKLCVPFQGAEEMTLQNCREVFPFLRTAVVRVFKVSGVGLISNFQFASKMTLAFLRNSPVAPDETIFLCDLERESFEAKTSVKKWDPQFKFLIVDTWLDRTSREIGEEFFDENEAKAKFENGFENLAGTAGGINVRLLLDVWEKKIIDFVMVLPSPIGAVRA